MLGFLCTLDYGVKYLFCTIHINSPVQNTMGLHEMIEMPRLEASEQISAACSEFLDRVCPKLSSDWTQLDITGHNWGHGPGLRRLRERSVPKHSQAVHRNSQRKGLRLESSCHVMPRCCLPESDEDRAIGVRSLSLRGLIGPFISSDHLVMTNSLPWKITMLLIEPSINGPFSMAMLNNQRVLAKCVSWSCFTTSSLSSSTSC